MQSKNQKISFLPEKVAQIKQAYIRNMFKKAFKSVQQLLCYLLTPSPTPPIHSAVKTQENTEEEPDDNETGNEEDMQVKYSSKCRSSNK
jgi:hypothetical protein